MNDRNLTFGLFITILGLILSLGSYFLIANIPLTAMGIGIIILGVAWALTPSNPLPKKTIQEIVKSSCSNIEALLEGLGAIEKAIYIPQGKGVIAYVPLKKSREVMLNEIAENNTRLIFRHGASLGVIVLPPNPSLDGIPSNDVHASLEKALIESEIVEAFKAIIDENIVIINVENPRINIEHPRFQSIMGSLPASIAAQTIATALNKPVKIEWEKPNKNHLNIRLRILEWTDKILT